MDLRPDSHRPPSTFLPGSVFKSNAVPNVFRRARHVPLSRGPVSVCHSRLACPGLVPGGAVLGSESKSHTSCVDVMAPGCASPADGSKASRFYKNQAISAGVGRPRPGAHCSLPRESANKSVLEHPRPPDVCALRLLVCRRQQSWAETTESAKSKNV